MLTVDTQVLGGLSAGNRLLDLGCGGGRHAFDAFRRGADVVALDRRDAEVKDVAGMFAAMRAEGQAPADTLAAAVTGDALALPFADASFDRLIAAEVLEHVVDDRGAVIELARVLRPGGRLAVTVPRWFPERVCWALSDGYHAPAVADGHVRIYRRRVLACLLEGAGLRLDGASYAHALHSPYWWLRCLVGLDRPDSWPVSQYHRFLVWDITTGNPAVRWLERTLDPVLGKSLVLYAVKP